MNKSDLIDAIAADSGLNKADAGRALDGFTSAVTSALRAVVLYPWLALEHFL